MTGSYLHRLVGAMILLAPLPWGCLDLTPTQVVETMEAGTTGDRCAACSQAPNQPGPGCFSELSACLAIDRCQQALECAEVRGCFRGGKELLVTCGSACATEAGITSLDDPGIVAATNFYACLLSACRDACFPE